MQNLPRTEGISSSEVRSEQCKLRMGIVGKAAFRTKFVAESKYVNGVDVIGVCASQKSEEPEFDGISNRRKERERTMRRFSSRNEHARTDNP